MVFTIGDTSVRDAEVLGQITWLRQHMPGEIDAAITEQFEADVSAGNVTLTAEQYRRAVWIKATGAATSGRTVTLQAIKRFVAIANFSTSDSVDFVLGAATITLAAATSATEPTAAVVYTDGTANGLYQISSGVGGGGGGSLYDLGFSYSGGPPGPASCCSNGLRRAISTLQATWPARSGTSASTRRHSSTWTSPGGRLDRHHQHRDQWHVHIHDHRRHGQVDLGG